MRFGKADRRITIERATEAVNDYGEREMTWSEVTTVWAELVKVGGLMESLKSFQDQATRRLYFQVRSSTALRAVTEKDRIVYAARNYDLVGIEEHGRNNTLILVCQKPTN